MDNSLEKQLIEIERLLSDEERRGLVEGLADLRVRQEALSAIDIRLNSAENELATRRRHYLTESEQRLEDYHRRWFYLSMLPREEDIIWAQQILQFPNLRIVVVDENENDGDIIRFLAIDATGKVCFDRFIKPHVPLSKHAAYMTGVTPQDMEEALSLKENWMELLHALSGKLILTRDINELQAVLQKHARLSNLAWPVIFGESIGQQAERYFHRANPITLDKLCGWIGHPLPAHPQQTALHRALGYLHILQTMAQGLITIQAKEGITDREWFYNEARSYSEDEWIYDEEWFDDEQDEEWFDDEQIDDEDEE